MLLNNPQDLPSMGDEELAKLYLDTVETEKDIYDQKVTIREEWLARLNERKKDGELPGNKYAVTKFSTVRFKTTVAQARKLGATKTEEKVDTKALRLMHDSGAEVPGVDIRTDVRITEVKE